MKRPFGVSAQTHIHTELLSAFLDGQVGPAERATIETHLSGCAICRQELESLRKTVALLGALPRREVPHAFTLSETTVAGRRSTTEVSWLGGLVRGLGVVAAMVLVVVLAATLFRQPMAVPGPFMARFAPTAATAESTSELPVAPAMVLEAPAPTSAVPEAPVPTAGERTITAVAETPQGQAEPPAALMAPPAGPTPEQEVTITPAPPATSAPAGPTESAPLARVAVPSATFEPSVAAIAPPVSGETPAADTKAFGLGGDVAAAAAPQDKTLAPELLPAMAAVTDVLPPTARLVYADLRALWALDRAEGLRRLAADETLNSPLLAPDGSYVVYRTARAEATTLWGVPWRDGKPRLLLTEAQLPKEGLAPQYSGRRLQDVEWVPGPGHRMLAVTLMAVPSPAAGEVPPPRTELWTLDIETGALRYVVDMGRAYRPYYAPDGKRFALLEYGTEADPQGRLTLFDTDGGHPRVTLIFPASPAKLSYETQLAWLPDSSALWLAIPAADPPAAGTLNSTKLYLVLAGGQAQEIGSLDAYQVAWAPNGVQLAYLRISNDETGEGELYLADADGANSQLYAAVQNAALLGWSPDGTHFLYQDNYQSYLGAAGRTPIRLGTTAGFFSPHWVSDAQFVSLRQVDGGWLLTLQGVDGSAYGLMLLSTEVMLDAVYR
ncbi:MAG: zf-HC2 domain-containing protein [Anaerolineae bacterium]